jgi:hypothetical protein
VRKDATMNRLLSRLDGQRWFLVGLAMLLVVVSIQYTHKARDGRSAISRWQPQLLGLDNDEDLSQRYNYPNPPIMAVLLYPLAKLPPLVGALVWFYLKVGMAALAIVWAFRLVETPERPFPPWAKALTVVLSLRPIMGDLQHGNVNLFILFLVVGFLTLWRLGRDLLAGGTLALAVACKVTPALFVPYLVWKRAWRALAGCAVGLLLFLWPGVVPALAIGGEENQRELASWYRLMVRSFVVEGQVTSEHNNQSLPGLAYRMLTHSPSFSGYDEHQVYYPKGYHNLAELPRAHVQMLLKGCMGLFALGVVVACRTPTPPRHGWRLGAEIAVVLLGMLLFSERTWKHHAVTLLLPFAVLCYRLTLPAPRWLRGGLAGSLTVSALLMATTSTGLLADELAKLAQVYGAYVSAYLVLLAALVVALLSPDAQGKAAAASDWRAPSCLEYPDSATDPSAGAHSKETAA